MRQFLDHDIGNLPPITTGVIAVIVSAAAYLVVAPNVGLFFSPMRSYDVQRIIQLAVLGISCIAVIHQPRILWVVLVRLPTSVRLLGYAILLIGTVSALVSPAGPYALREVALFGGLTVFTLANAAASTIYRSRYDRFILGALSVLAVLYLAVFLAIRYSDGFRYGEPAILQLHGFINPRFFGQLQTWSLPLLLIQVSLARKEDSVTFVWHAAVIVGWWMLFFLYASRGGMVGLAVGAILVATIYKRNAVAWLGLAVSTACIGWIWSHLIVPRPWNTATGLTDALDRGVSTSGRTEIWVAAMDSALAHPILGLGPGRFASPELIARFRVAHPHNFLLHWAVEWGMVSAILLAGLLGIATYHWLQREYTDGQRQRYPVALGLSASLTAATLHAMFSGIIVMPVSQTLGAVIIGWALGVYWRTGEQKVEMARSPNAFVATRIIVAAIVIALSVGASLPIHKGSGDKRLAPRFWVHGDLPDSPMP